jgi:predicted nucleotidyltransferase
MSRTVLDLTPEEIAEYRRAARVRWEREQQERVRRLQHAWEVARAAAQLLRERFGATRVVVFGSLVHDGCFTPWSDVDIAAWGIHPEDTFRAVGAVMDLDSEIEVNLVDVGACRPSLLTVIEEEGVDL